MKTNVKDAGLSILRRETFDAGSLRGERQPVNPSMGRLPDEPVHLYRADEQGERIEYLVSSYGTPIGWATGTGRVVIPSIRYSTTTSRHQGIVKVNLIARTDRRDGMTAMDSDDHDEPYVEDDPTRAENLMWGPSQSIAYPAVY